MKTILTTTLTLLTIALLIWINKVNNDINYLKTIENIRYQQEWNKHRELTQTPTAPQTTNPNKATP